MSSSDLDDLSQILPWDYAREDCGDTDDEIAPYPDIDARCFPTAPLYVTGNVPGAMLWNLAGADGDCDGAAFEARAEKATRAAVSR